MTTEETNAGEGVTHAIDDIDTDESKNEKRKSRAKSVTLKDEALARSNSGKLYNVTHVLLDCWQSVFLSKFSRDYEQRGFKLKGNVTSATAIPSFCVRDLTLLSGTRPVQI